MNEPIYIIKGNGEREPFNEEKLRASLNRAGASTNQIDDIASHIVADLEPGMTTDKIFRHAYSLLKRMRNPNVTSRYSLRRALLQLGPTGFPFEKFFSEILKIKGYEIALNQTVLGRCVSHEIDVVGWNNDKLVMVESKFHNRVGEKSDLKVALYVKARFDDLSEQHFNYGQSRLLDEGWLVTNTKFTSNAIRYGECAKLKMIGWNYPKKGSLRELIEDLGLHPITCLSTLSQHEKQLLLNSGVVICRQIKESGIDLSSIGIGAKKESRVKEEIKMICEN